MNTQYFERMKKVVGSERFDEERFGKFDAAECGYVQDWAVEFLSGGGTPEELGRIFFRNIYARVILDRRLRDEFQRSIRLHFDYLLFNDIKFEENEREIRDEIKSMLKRTINSAFNYLGENADTDRVVEGMGWWLDDEYYEGRYEVLHEKAFSEFEVKDGDETAAHLEYEPMTWIDGNKLKALVLEVKQEREEKFGS